MKVCLINVGANASHGSLRSPLFSSGEFEFVPIPDQLMDYLGYESYTKYQDLKPANGQGVAGFLKRRFHMMCVHNDPEFETRTYGDYPTESPRASNLRKLTKGDFLFFFARLVEWLDNRFTKKAGFYIIGGFEISAIYRDIVESPSKHVYRRIKNNAHVTRGEANPILYDGFWVFKGTKRLGRFRYAIPLDRRFVESCHITDSKSESWKWQKYQTELSAIGSYLRSAKLLEDPKQIECFLEYLSMHDGIPSFCR